MERGPCTPFAAHCLLDKIGSAAFTICARATFPPLHYRGAGPHDDLERWSPSGNGDFTAPVGEGQVTRSPTRRLPELHSCPLVTPPSTDLVEKAQASITGSWVAVVIQVLRCPSSLIRVTMLGVTLSYPVLLSPVCCHSWLTDDSGLKFNQPHCRHGRFPRLCARLSRCCVCVVCVLCVLRWTHPSLPDRSPVGRGRAGTPWNQR
ncbi:hypothetical protein EDB80DRAFT_90338 [Ilyonectria destructans]|nr:hypothetical protein EDB80DRAFT_90338 [Ilyonectria destructans]